jgi:hypothetical protein
MGGREVLYNILLELGVPMKLLRLIKMCSNETYSKVCIGKHLSDNFPILSCLNLFCWNLITIQRYILFELHNSNFKLKKTRIRN